MRPRYLFTECRVKVVALVVALVFRGDRVDIDSLKASIGGGTVVAGGSVTENAAAGTVVATLGTADSDAGDSLSVDEQLQTSSVSMFSGSF